jgi:putative transposase
LPKTLADKRSWIDFDNDSISVREQCELLGVHRSNVYYQPLEESDDNLAIMRVMDEEHLRHPFKGRRQMTEFLRRDGFAVNPKRVRRLMKIMGIEAIAPKPKTTIFCKGHKVYPYLLRGLTIERPDQVACSDITYIPTCNGYLYLCAVMDWYSRYVLSWKLSNSLDTTFVLEALDDALAISHPEIFNTDQGSQFTSFEFTNRLIESSIDISMDGVGRATDNAFIERLWRTVKYEEVYLKEYASGDETYTSLKRYFEYYNFERTHQGLNNQTPWEVYRPRRKRRSQGSI